VSYTRVEVFLSTGLHGETLSSPSLDAVLTLGPTAVFTDCDFNGDWMQSIVNTPLIAATEWMPGPSRRRGQCRKTGFSCIRQPAYVAAHHIESQQ
jgi:hypothetical protein